MPNPTDTARLREFLGGITKLPWSNRGKLMLGVIIGGPHIEYTNGSSQAQIASVTLGDGILAEEREANAAAIIAVMNAAPAMLDELDALRARVAELEADRKSLAKTCSWCGCSPVIEACADDCMVKQLAQETLAARDARMRREGAAEEIETTMERWHDQPFPEYAKQRAARLRESGE